MSERQAFLEEATRDGANIAALCRRFGIARKTGYKWIARWRSDGGTGVGDRSRRPHTSPTTTPENVVDDLLSVRQEHPTWGARKITSYLLMKHPERCDLPAPSTITEILRRQYLIDPQATATRRHFQRFEHAEPNELWQMDFKGHFPLANKQRCHALDIIDDHSRFVLALDACGNQQTLTVQKTLRAVFRQYGLPDRMLMDNGSPWGQDQAHRHTPLTAWLMQMGIAISHGRPYHPQTQGKLERFHRTLGEDVLAGQVFADHPAAQQAFDAWRVVYNEERPHEAIAMAVPATRYRPSQRVFPETLPVITYPESMQVRRVMDKGKINFQGRLLRVSRAFIGHPVGLAPTEEDGLWNVHFCQFVVAQLDLRVPSR
jgi:transposase InsO family protein